MEWLVVGLGALGVGLGFGFGFLKFIPKPAKKVVGVVALASIAVMFWDLIGLPAVELLQTLLKNAWIAALSLGFLIGKEVGEFF